MFEKSCKNEAFKLSGPYKTLDEAVQGGFLKIRKSYPNWKFYEYGFWVIFNMETDSTGKPQKTYRYTTPQTDCSEYKVELLKPEGIVKAHCHTHPKGGETFSDEDRTMFKKFAADIYPTPFYLMTPMMRIKVADKEEDFLMGRSVNEIKGVIP